ncbi:hypothetical protein O3G_MSEX009070 [Manduca sexta]|uniref:Uncharacterized protein n=1 Tax=Manduca sexta TaxID=7130 RepID=A0A921ZDX3_MANSE|nr:hypothetical protein O3G_MSEX009070 [Manduca sexta]
MHTSALQRCAGPSGRAPHYTARRRDALTDGQICSHTFISEEVHRGAIRAQFAMCDPSHDVIGDLIVISDKGKGLILRRKTQYHLAQPRILTMQVPLRTIYSLEYLCFLTLDIERY